MTEKEANLSKNFMEQISPKTQFKKNKINGVKKLLLFQVAKVVLENQQLQLTLQSLLKI